MLKPRKKPSGPSDTPSLVRKKKEEKPEEEQGKVVKQESKEEFDEEALQGAWQSFKERKKSNNAGEMEILLLERELSIIDGPKLQIKLNSSLEASILERFEIDLLGYLRQSLKNDLISIEKNIVEDESSARKLYTSSDKFEYMVQQNPALKTLKEKLGLDFEF